MTTIPALPAAYLHTTTDGNPDLIHAQLTETGARLGWPPLTTYADAGRTTPGLLATINSSMDLTTPSGRLAAQLAWDIGDYPSHHNATLRSRTTSRPRSQTRPTHGRRLLDLACAIAEDHHDALLIPALDHISHDPADIRALTTLCHQHNVTIHTTH